jgi:hypothetical protein
VYDAVPLVTARFVTLSVSNVSEFSVCAGFSWIVTTVPMAEPEAAAATTADIAH